MGIWGRDAFDNDSVQDWLVELHSAGVSALRTSLSIVANAETSDGIDVDDGTCAVAAAEIVAAADDSDWSHLPPQVIEWLVMNESSLVPEDRVLARGAVERLTVGRSEVRALHDAGEDASWLSEMLRLQERLGGDVASASNTATVLVTGKPREEPSERDKQVLTTFLRARGFELTPDQSARIANTRSAAEVRRWIGGAVDAPSVAALLEG
jgi:hypothetical protein